MTRGWTLPGRPAGFTLVELLIVITLLGLVMGGISTVVLRQQRFYRGANEILDTRSRIRQAASILPADLRGLSSSGGDISAMTPTAVEIRTNIGSSIVCERPAADLIVLPPATLANGNTLTSFLSRPAVGDTLFVYDDGPDLGNADDFWGVHRITAIDSLVGTVCLPATGYTQLGDALSYRYRVTVTPALGGTVATGAPVRFTRRVRYSLYAAGDGRSYLGYDQYGGGSWAGVQPVSGPYLPADATRPELGGLQFRYYDPAGTELTSVADAPRVARIDVIVRGESRRAVQLTGSAASTFRDSLAVTVAIRNRN